MKLFKTVALFAGVIAASVAMHANADVVTWNGPTHTITLGLSEEDISHIEFPEEIINITLENSDYVDILVVKGYANRGFRMRSLLPKMATRAFFTGQSGKTYIAVLTTDVPYRSFIQIVDGQDVEELQRKIAKKFDMNDLVKAMALDEDLPGVLRETHVVPGWFKGNGLTFDMSEVWQTAKLTGLVVHVQNEYPVANEVNLPAVTIPKTSEWGTLRKASMDNLRLAPRGKPNDKGVMYLVFSR